MQYGYFDNEKREYVIDKRGSALFLDELSGCRGHGGGHQPYGGRLSVLQNTGVSQDHPVPWECGTMDRPGFYVYIRDNEKKDYHSISCQPVPRMYPRQNTVAATDCLTPSTRANMTDWHPHRPWLFPAGKMYCCKM